MAADPPEAAEVEALRTRVAALAAEAEELRTRLAEETARRNQLLGQRALLRSLLAERPAAAAPGAGQGSALLEPLRAWWAPAPASPPAEPASASPPLRALPDGSSPSVVLVLTWSLGEAELDRAIELVLRAAPATGVLPVFLTDRLDLGPFRRHRALVEFLPSAEQQGRHAGDLDWPAYLARRLQILAAKWQAGRVVVLGRAARARLEGLLPAGAAGEFALFRAALFPAAGVDQDPPALPRRQPMLWFGALRRLVERRRARP